MGAGAASVFFCSAPRVCDGCRATTRERQVGGGDNRSNKSLSTCNSGCLEAAPARFLAGARGVGVASSYSPRNRHRRRRGPAAAATNVRKGGTREESALSSPRSLPLSSLSHAPSAEAQQQRHRVSCVPALAAPGTNQRDNGKRRRRNLSPSFCFLFAPGRPKALKPRAHTQAAATAVAPITAHVTAP